MAWMNEAPQHMTDLRQRLQKMVPAAWYLLLHPLEANFITPMLLGRRFTLNPVVIFVFLIFWTWLWGVPGALLSVPILVSIKVVCDRIPSMSQVSELLTSESNSILENLNLLRLRKQGRPEPDATTRCHETSARQAGPGDSPGLGGALRRRQEVFGD